MKILGKLGIACFFLANLASVQAQTFNPGSIEVFASTSGYFGSNDVKGSSSDYSASYFGIRGMGVYYVVPNLGIGIDFLHSEAAYDYTNGTTDKVLTDIWSPLVAFNIDINENSGFLVGASKTGVLQGKTKIEYGNGTSTSSDYSGRNLFVYFRHYLTPNIALSAGLIFEKYVRDTNDGSYFHSDATDVNFGFVIGFPG